MFREMLDAKREFHHAQRRYPIGAEVIGKDQTHFRVWAPRAREIDVVLEDGAGSEPIFYALTSEPGGYFSGAGNAGAGTRYRFRVNAGENFYPDPASRFQPKGPHGPSCVVDPRQFRWADTNWPGPALAGLKGQIIYEMHIGTFTKQGTWRAAAEQLPELARIGITVIEMMPVAEFPGKFGWGYDGVNLFAPSHLYGTPDDLRAFIARAHSLGLAVILDVVYNHFGPDGNYLGEFSDDYLSKRYANEWGDPINFDGHNSHGVREFFIANATYWIDEYHFDGLRLDATQQIFDASEDNILAAITRAVRTAAHGRGTYIVAENEAQESKLVRSPETGGHGMDALWNDDFHHTAIVACTGHSEAYYSDYKGTPQEFISALKWGYLYQGQWYSWQKNRRGTPSLDLHPSNFVTYMQNHDQVANSLRGRRLHQTTSPGRFRAITALMLLGPGTPMLFQGQEFGASAPFYYFADHNPELAKLVGKGRKDFLKQFPSIACPECESILVDPESEETFRNSKLDLSERQKHAEIYQMHRDLLRLRRADPVFANPRRHGLECAVLAQEAFVLRFFGSDQNKDPELQRL